MNSYETRFPPSVRGGGARTVSAPESSAQRSLGAAAPLAVLSLALGLSFLVGCGDDEPTGPTPDFTLSVSPTAVSVEADAAAPAGPAPSATRGAADLTVTVARTGGFDGAVVVTVEGLPAGVTASDLSIAAEQTSGTVTLTASAAAAEGQSTLTVRGTATGVEAKEASVTLTVTSPPAQSISLALDPTELPLEQGQNGEVAVTLTRTNYTADVTLGASSDPAGLESSFDPATVSGTGSTLTVTAPAALAEGTYALTVTATGEGVESQQATLAVTVTAPSGTGNVSLTFCEDTGTPAWVAYQDGTGEWTQATLTPPATYSFEISSATGGVAWVVSDGESELDIFYGSREELQQYGAALCGEPGATRTVTGTVAGLENEQTGWVSLGGASAFVVPGSTSFTLSDVRTGIVDLIAHRTETASDGTGFIETLPNKVIIRRGLDPDDGSELAVIDFEGSEAFDPVERSLTVTNDQGQLLSALAGYNTANGETEGALSSASGSVSRYFGIPGDQQEEGDLHSLLVTATELQNNEPVSNRIVFTWFTEATDKTVDLGPELSTPTLTVEATDPVVRVRAELPTQAEYDRLWSVGYAQDNGRNVAIQVFEGFGVGETLDVSIPDFTGVGGWNDAWGLAPGAEIFWYATGVGFEGIGFEEPAPTDGATARTGTLFGSINP